VTFEFEGFDFSSGQGHAAPTFGDLFAEVFAQRQDSHAGDPPAAGADLHASVSITFDEAMAGTQRPLTLTRRETCFTCQGAGTLRVPEARCQRCQGSGVVRSRRGNMVFSKACESCAGSGRMAQTTCAACGGTGQQTRTETVTVRVPPGVSDGSRIRVAEKGHSGAAGARLGDLYITVHVEPHEQFHRAGDDLHVVVPVAVHEAALGARIEVPAPDGQARLRVPPGTQAGQRFRVRGRGAPSPRSGERGDLVVEVKLVLPRLLDERSKELLREFGRINSADVRK
jgi:molecular chaperone DnaJ